MRLPAFCSKRDLRQCTRKMKSKLGRWLQRTVAAQAGAIVPSASTTRTTWKKKWLRRSTLGAKGAPGRFHVQRAALLGARSWNRRAGRLSRSIRKAWSVSEVAPIFHAGRLSAKSERDQYLPLARKSKLVAQLGHHSQRKLSKTTILLCILQTSRIGFF